MTFSQVHVCLQLFRGSNIILVRIFFLCNTDWDLKRYRGNLIVMDQPTALTWFTDLYCIHVQHESMYVIRKYYRGIYNFNLKSNVSFFIYSFIFIFYLFNCFFFFFFFFFFDISKIYSRHEIRNQECAFVTVYTLIPLHQILINEANVFHTNLWDLLFRHLTCGQQ